MYDVTDQFDNLAAIRGTIQLLPGTASPSTLRDLEDLRMQTKRNLTAALRLLDEDELEDIIESLDSEYNNEARGELEALM